MASITRYDPFNDLVDDIFKGFLVRPVAVEGGRGDALPRVKVDVAEQNGAYKVTAELPGVKKDDIHVSVDQNEVTISAEIKREAAEKEGERVLLSESRNIAKADDLPSIVNTKSDAAGATEGAQIYDRRAVPKCCMIVVPHHDRPDYTPIVADGPGTEVRSRTSDQGHRAVLPKVRTTTRGYDNLPVVVDCVCVGLKVGQQHAQVYRHISTRHPRPRYAAVSQRSRRNPHAGSDHGVFATAPDSKESNEVENGSSRHGSTLLADDGQRTALVRLNPGARAGRREHLTASHSRLREGMAIHPNLRNRRDTDDTMLRPLPFRKAHFDRSLTCDIPN